jgi:hypothetical protein
VQREGKKLVTAARLWALGQLRDPRAQEDEEAAQFDTTDEAAAGFGLRIVDEDDDEEAEGAESTEEETKFYLWLCNLQTFDVWRQIQTQWVRNAMGELDGLNYGSVISYMKNVAGIKRKDFAEMYSAIQAMEGAILKLQAEKRST